MPTIALVDDDRNILTSVAIALEARSNGIQFLGHRPTLALGRLRGVGREAIEFTLLGPLAHSLGHTCL